MPRVSMVRYSVQKGDSAAEIFRSEEGTTYGDVLRHELCINPDKYTIYVNGAEAALDDLVQEGDTIVTRARNYSSGI